MSDFHLRHQELKALATLLTSIADSTTSTLVAAFKTDGFSRLTGTVRSDRALTLRIKQGLGSDGNYAYKTDVAVPAAVGDGAGAGFSVEVLAQDAIIQLINASGGVATVYPEANLRSGT